MKHTLRIPTKDPYAYIEVEFEGTPDEAIAEYARITQVVKGEVGGTFQKVQTFTGETILYDELNHKYKTLEGATILSGSGYKRLLKKPFPSGSASKAVAKKLNIDSEEVLDMWSRNGEMSTKLGTSLHLAMEQWYKHRNHGGEKNYHLPKHPFLRQAVLSFPYRDLAGHPEIFVSDVANKRAGQIDLLKPEEDKTYTVIDYKSDAEIEKSLPEHFAQASFYGHIVTNKGFPVKNVEIWNYGTEWTCYKSPLLALIDIPKEHAT